MPQPSPQAFPKTSEHLKFVLTIVIFVFSLGVGYQRLENRVDAKQSAIEVTVAAKLASLDEKSAIERNYIQQELKDIKSQLAEIQVYLRDKK